MSFAQTQAHNWDIEDKSEMVSIGSHKLYLSASGPDRKAGEPVVLLMQGMGSTIDEWVAVKKIVTRFARWIEYDRSGLGKSESPPEAPESISAVSVAKELDVLLKTAGVEPPFVVVCHSWGGITAREFLHLRPQDIVGMVFVDANTEKSFDGGDWPRSYVNNVIGDINWIEVTGLAADQVLTVEEFQAVLNEQSKPRSQATEASESRGYRGDPVVLAAKKQFEKQPLGNRPISVITAWTWRDFQRMYDAGVAAGNGTEDERELFRELLSKWKDTDRVQQSEILKLSSFGRHQYAEASGHNVQMAEPSLVANEIRWVLDQVIE